MENPSTETRRKPSVKCTLSADEQIIYFLAKANWYGGDPEKVNNAPVDKVINAFHYENFARDYENTFIEINKETK